MPVIIPSGSAHSRDINGCYSLSAHAYLAKPMTPEGMVQQIKTLVHFWLESATLPAPLTAMD